MAAKCFEKAAQLPCYLDGMSFNNNKILFIHYSIVKSTIHRSDDFVRRCNCNFKKARKILIRLFCRAFGYIQNDRYTCSFNLIRQASMSTYRRCPKVRMHHGSEFSCSLIDGKFAESKCSHIPMLTKSHIYRNIP